MLQIAMKRDSAQVFELEPTKIMFTDLAPQGVEMDFSWRAMGKDDSGIVYIGFNAKHVNSEFAPREDVLVFKYDPATQERTYLGSWLETAREAGTLWDSGETSQLEEIPKGHTAAVYADGKMYFGSQGFHDFKDGLNVTKYEALHGAHIFAVNIATQTLEDVTRNEVDGVAIRHEGIICHTYSPWLGLLIGMTHPHGDISVFDVKGGSMQKVVKGIPWDVAHSVVSREIVVTKTGYVYLYRGPEKSKYRKESYSIWRYDLNSDAEASTETDFKTTGGMWVGQARTKDDRFIYVSSVNGQVYRLDVDADSWSYVGYMRPQGDFDTSDDAINIAGFALSPDEKSLCGIVGGYWKGATDVGRMYRMDLDTGDVSLALLLDWGMYTGSDVRVGNTLYFVGASPWTRPLDPYLLSIDFPPPACNTLKPKNQVWTTARCQERCGDANNCGSSPDRCARMCSAACACGGSRFGGSR
eukprot:TRINITY_DN3798_c0_g1_i1.p1 TRINITY_DN3798_c0_g1~~TRINITY_DN3798_c0_g1_i1.p1  ORF type:complete len:520 (-),score=67.23 TRINITY_DN3798_c0_g1_i1:80-1486(-)